MSAAVSPQGGPAQGILRLPGRFGRVPPRHAGQALVLGLLLVAAAGVAWTHLHNIGLAASARARLLHAADAAAYSGALLQARAFNMHAYVNRAQVAHQVAMAHLATLGSWAQWGAAQARQSARGNPPAALMGMLFGPDYGASYSASRAAAGLDADTRDGGALAQAFARHERTVHDVLAAARDALTASLPAAREAGMRAVLAANFRGRGGVAATSASAPAVAPAVAPDDEAVLRGAGLRMALRQDTLPGTLALHRVQQGAGLRGLVDAAAGRYRFLDPRRGTARNPWPVSTRCPHLRHELRRLGGTRLSADGLWQSGDTLSFHALRSNRWIGCYYREYPMGWGLQHARGAAPSGYGHAVPPPADFSAQDFWRWVRANTGWDLFGGGANPLADSHALAGAARWPSRGLPGYADLSAGAPAAVGIALTLSQDAARLATSDADGRVRLGPGGFAFSAWRPGDTMTVSSAAQTYFARPEPRADGREELASLFHPYWQARLAPAAGMDSVREGS